MNSPDRLFSTVLTRGLAVLTAFAMALALAPTAKPASTAGPNPSAASPSPRPGAHALRAPAFLGMAFAQSAQAPSGAPAGQSEAGFLLKDAGISAYTHLSRTLNLSTLRPLFRAVERESDELLIGTLPPPGYRNLRELGESMDVHAYVRKDGWIVAYLLAQTPTARIIDWLNYDTDKLSQSTLERTVVWLADQSGAARPEVTYYHFQYPAAAALTLVADREDRPAARDTFQIKLPQSLAVFERSWSSASTYFSICRVEQKELSRLAGAVETWKMQAGSLDPQDLPAERLTEFSLYNEALKYRSYCGVAILHGEVPA